MVNLLLVNGCPNFFFFRFSKIKAMLFFTFYIDPYVRFCDMSAKLTLQICRAHVQWVTYIALLYMVYMLQCFVKLINPCLQHNLSSEKFRIEF